MTERPAGLILAAGKLLVEQLGDEIRLVIPCPTCEEADLTFNAIIEAWNRTGELRLMKAAPKTMRRPAEAAR